MGIRYKQRQDKEAQGSLARKKEYELGWVWVYGVSTALGTGTES